MSTQPWYIAFFNEDYLRLYPETNSPERIHAETDGILKFLNLPPGTALLDLCCGYGRHAIALAQRGYKVTGFDLSQPLLTKAKTDAERAGVNVQWVHGDMRQLPFHATFDAVINAFNSFGYFDNDSEDQLVLDQVTQALKQGGLFLQQVGNRDAFVRSYQPIRAACFSDDLILIEERQFDILTSRLCGHIRWIHPNGRRTHSEFQMRIYTPTELARMLHAAGLELEAYFGGLDGTNLTIDSTYIVMLSCKR